MESSVPPCVRFSPTDREIIEKFLLPMIREENIPHCLIKKRKLKSIVSRPRSWNNILYPYFKRGEYWVFSKRKRVKRNSLLANRNLEGLGKWKTSGEKKNIYAGNIIVGHKQKFVLLKDGDKTGWSMFEYIKRSKKFQKRFISHVIYDNTVIDNIENDEENEESTDSASENDEDDQINQEQLLQDGDQVDVLPDQELNLELGLGRI